MTTTEKTLITIEARVKGSPEKIWKTWTTPADVVQWNTADPSWHTPRAENDLRTGGTFLYRMEAKDGSFGFDFGGTYDAVTPHTYIEYTMGDGRNVKNHFTADGDQVHILIHFEAEDQNPIDMQKAGWQSILDSFKKYTESH